MYAIVKYIPQHHILAIIVITTHILHKIVLYNYVQKTLAGNEIHYIDLSSKNDKVQNIK